MAPPREMVLPSAWLGSGKCFFVARPWAWLRIVACGIWGSEELRGCCTGMGILGFLFLPPPPPPLATI